MPRVSMADGLGVFLIIPAHVLEWRREVRSQSLVAQIRKSPGKRQQCGTR